MTTLSIHGFLNKRDAAEAYRRSHRSLSRDVTTAVKLGDAEYLAHWRLETQDGAVRLGTEVTIELLDALRDAGQVPTWWAEPEFLAVKYGKRGEGNASGEGSGGGEDLRGAGVAASAPAGGGGSAAAAMGTAAGVVPLLERQIAELQSDKRHLLQELERSYELRKEDNELREQNNELMGKLYGLLTSMQQAPGNTFVLQQAPTAGPAAPAGPAPQVVDVNATGREDPQRASRSPEATLSATGKATAGPRRKRAKGREATPPTALQKYLPTISGWFRAGR